MAPTGSKPRLAGPRVYDYIFSMLFWGLCLLPLFKAGTSIAALPTDFLGRSQLIEGFNRARLALGDRAFPTVLVGKDGWMYYESDHELADYQHTNGATTSELQAVQQKLDAIHASLQRRGILFLLVIPPDKATIYPGYVPDELQIAAGPSRLDQLVQYLSLHGQTRIIDLRPELQAAARTEQVYFKTDTHWNDIGAQIASVKVLSALSERFPALQPPPLSDLAPAPGPALTRNLPTIMGLPYIQEAGPLLAAVPARMPSVNILLPAIAGRGIRLASNEDQSLPVALIYHDSFFDSVLPILEPHFSRTVSLKASGLDLWSMRWVDVVHPDVVVVEFVENELTYGDYFIPAPN